MIYVLTLICAGNVPVADCTTKTARAYHTVTEQSVVCGLPSQNKFPQSPLSPNENEYILIKCKRG